ncbi:MAG: DUF3592 domain-containing protein [Fibrobacteres bacterium]|jgi:hypothetical protein|nr:DUF3592 domain-containing protein [Fibrobacterota bacterium]
MNRPAIILAWVFATVGTLSLIGFAYAMTSEVRFLRHAVAMEGRVVGLPDRATDQPIYLYEFPAGTVRRGRSLGGSSSDQYLSGDRLPLYVDARDPDSAQIRRFDHQWLLPITLGTFAALFGGIGYGILGYGRRRRDLERKIRDRGVRIRADIVGIDSVSNFMVNGINPWRIQAQALIDRKVHRFASGNLWFDPSPYLDRNQVEVMYLAENPKKHWMDLTFLPEYAG